MGDDLFAYHGRYGKKKDENERLGNWIKYSYWYKEGWKVTRTILSDGVSNREEHPDNPALANLNDKFVFIVGGTFRKVGTTDYYDIARDTWTLGPKMTAPRYELSAIVLGGILYAFNGSTPNYHCIESLDAQSLVNGQDVGWQNIELVMKLLHHRHVPYICPINAAEIIVFGNQRGGGDPKEKVEN